MVVSMESVDIPFVPDKLNKFDNQYMKMVFLIEHFFQQKLVIQDLSCNSSQHQVSYFECNNLHIIQFLDSFVG